ncbi:hypothetical protein [Endozoicomonas sp. 8E]|uniref:hypothetical protein n=1 Tax=Endozoicomonas sp. 8E TaxID=3035692 RepID=UPI002939431F|nr:hypothetical protein [Endozoicomonas sp. 8E]WOG27982.1 hypothetical protein P6910_26145 [Endozoicomonas sp. 8E]
MRSLSRNGARIVAANTVQEGTAQRQDSLRTGLMNLGRSAQGQGLQGINSAAALESPRNQAAVQQSARNQGGFFGTIGTVAGIGAAAPLF